MKNNSMQIVPNGKIPPNKIKNKDDLYHTLDGMFLSIKLILTGKSIRSFLYP